MAARVATVAVIRMYLRVMNDGWVRGVGSDTDMDGKEDPFFFLSFWSLVGNSDDDGDDTDNRQSLLRPVSD